MARDESTSVKEFRDLFIAGRSSVGCWCLQVRWFGRYRVIWPTRRTTRLWRKVTG